MRLLFSSSFGPERASELLLNGSGEGLESHRNGPAGNHRAGRSRHHPLPAWHLAVSRCDLLCSWRSLSEDRFKGLAYGDAAEGVDLAQMGSVLERKQCGEGGVGACLPPDPAQRVPVGGSCAVGIPPHQVADNAGGVVAGGAG